MVPVVRDAVTDTLLGLRRDALDDVPKRAQLRLRFLGDGRDIFFCASRFHTSEFRNLGIAADYEI